MLDATSPIHPSPELSKHFGKVGAYQGLCMRDHIAIEAMKAIIIANPQNKDWHKIKEWAYSMSDQMIEKSQKEKPHGTF